MCVCVWGGGGGVLNLGHSRRSVSDAVTSPVPSLWVSKPERESVTCG